MATRKTKTKTSKTARKSETRRAVKATTRRARASVTPLVRVTGIGGMFFKAGEPAKLMAWYKKHLGIAPDPYGGWSFQWRDKRRPQRIGTTVFSPFASDTKYFEPSEQPYMFNFRVADLKSLLNQLRREGVHVVGDVQEFPYGKFAWIIDPEGRKIELWEPPADEESSADGE